MKNFSYINTLVSDTEDTYEIKTLFENIDRTIEMLDEEAPVPSSPMKNVKQTPQEYPNYKSKNISSPNSQMVQAWINPSTLGPRYILIEVEKFKNLSPEDCAKLTNDIDSTRQNLPASTQNMKDKDMKSPDKSFGMMKMLVNSFTTIFFMQGARYIITSVIIPALILGKNAAMGLLGFSKNSSEDSLNNSDSLSSETVSSKLSVFKDPKWIIAAGASVSLLIIFTKILKRYNKKNKKNSGVQTNIQVSNISNESIDLIITNEYYDNDIPFKKSLEIMNESILNINKIKSFFDTGFDAVKNSCETIEDTPDTQSKFKSFLEKIAGITNYCLIKAKSMLAGNTDIPSK